MFSKGSASRVINEEEVAAIAATSDAVIAGFGDCGALDAGKILLCNILGRCPTDVVSNQILRGQFPGGSGSGPGHQVGRFECK